MRCNGRGGSTVKHTPLLSVCARAAKNKLVLFKGSDRAEVESNVGSGRD